MKASQLLVVCTLFGSAVSSAAAKVVSVSVKEGDKVTINTDVTVTAQERLKWYFSDTRIGQIIGGQRSICTEECPEQFRGRLDLDQTGSLTITDTRTTHSGLYQLQIFSSSSSSMSEKIFNVTVIGTSDADRDVCVIKGDSVTLNTDVKTNQNDRIKWYFNDTRIAQIIAGQSYICSDAECLETFRFRDRLELEQTGSLTITNINITDAGHYRLQIINSSGRMSETSFNVTVCDAPSAKQDEMKTKSVKEGESLSLDPGEIKHPNDVTTWYFKDTLIAEITRDQSKLCADDQCKERFRDRLKLDQTGSLTITDIRNTDSGLYKLQIRSSRFSIIRSFSVTVTVSGLSGGVIAGICVGAAAVLLLIAACVCVFCKRRRKSTGTRSRAQHSIQVNGVQSEIPLMDAANEKSSKRTDVKYTVNGLFSNHVEIEPEAASEI